MDENVIKSSLEDVLLWPDNRIGLWDFWSCNISLAFISLSLQFLIITFVDSYYEALILRIILSTPFCWMSTALTINRLHDRNHSGWFSLLLFIPLIQLWCLYELYFMRGTKWQNRFGNTRKLEPSVWKQWLYLLSGRWSKLRPPIAKYLIFFMFLKYVRKKKIVLLSITAVAISVSLLIVVASLFSGFIDKFEHAAVEAFGDIIINPPTAISDYDKLIENLEQTSSVEAATAMTFGYGLLLVDMGNVRAVSIMGIESESRNRVTDFNQYLLSNKYPSPNAQNVNDSNTIKGLVGIGVLTEPDETTDEYDIEKAKKYLGKAVTLTTGQGDSISDFKRKVVQFGISDIVETGAYQFDHDSIYLPLEEFSKVIYPDEPPLAQQIQIKLARNTDTEAAIAIIRGVWRNFVDQYYNSDASLIYQTDIDTALELQSDMITEYRKQMGVLLVIFGAVSFGVVLLILCIFSLIVRLKQKDIAVIKSCGMASTSVAWIFIGFGACVGTVGSGLGVILGYIITKNINTIEEWIRIIFGLKLWKSSVYFFTEIPNEVDWSYSLRVVLFAIAAAIIGAVIPAIIAAMTKPVKLLRYE